MTYISTPPLKLQIDNRLSSFGEEPDKAELLIAFFEIFQRLKKREHAS